MANPRADWPLACAFLLIPLLLVGCRKPRAEAEPAISETVDCDALLEELRSVKTGAQPCEDDGDCTTWPEAENWDGCPVEVNLDSAGKMDGIRKRLEEAGCQVEKGAACAPMAIQGCGNGRCGHHAALGQKLDRENQLTDEQMKMLSERVKNMMKATGLKPAADASTTDSRGEGEAP